MVIVLVYSNKYLSIHPRPFIEPCVVVVWKLELNGCSVKSLSLEFSSDCISIERKGTEVKGRAKISQFGDSSFLVLGLVSGEMDG